MTRHDVAKCGRLPKKLKVLEQVGGGPWGRGAPKLQGEGAAAGGEERRMEARRVEEDDEDTKWGCSTAGARAPY